MGHLMAREARIRANQPARLTVAGKSFDVVIKNISKGFRGVGLEAPHPVEVFPGSTVEVHLVHQSLAVVAKGVLRWSVGGARLGVEVHSVRREKLPASLRDEQPAPPEVASEDMTENLPEGP